MRSLALSTSAGPRLNVRRAAAPSAPAPPPPSRRRTPMPRARAGGRPAEAAPAAEKQPTHAGAGPKGTHLNLRASDTEGGFIVSQADKAFFDANGYVVIRQVLSEEEMAAEIDPVYFAFLRGEVKVTGKDAMEMGAGALAAARGQAAAAGRPDGGAVAAAGGGAGAGNGDGGGAGFALFNVMLPRMYKPEWQGNVFQLRALDVANQLRGGDMAVDFDQIFAKAPHTGGSAFSWHQDQAYWPQTDEDPSAATCWLAVSDATLENGCLRYLPGSHLEGRLRTHYTVGDPATATTLYTPVDEATERVVPVPVRRGDLIVHHERCVHSSQPNRSDGWRHVYVLSMHKRAWVAAERARGITYSYNDAVNWQAWNRWGPAPEAPAPDADGPAAAS